jgi:hypothetical protein
MPPVEQLPNAKREATEPEMRYCPICERCVEADNMMHAPNEQPDVCWDCWDAEYRR